MNLVVGYSKLNGIFGFVAHVFDHSCLIWTGVMFISVTRGHSVQKVFESTKIDQSYTEQHIHAHDGTDQTQRSCKGVKVVRPIGFFTEMSKPDLRTSVRHLVPCRDHIFNSAGLQRSMPAGSCWSNVLQLKAPGNQFSAHAVSQEFEW